MTQKLNISRSQREPARNTAGSDEDLDPVAAKLGHISRTTVNYWLDFALLVVFLLLWFSTLVLRFVFPPGAYASGCTLWGWDYGHWLSFQFGVLVVFSLGVLLHLMLHWTWVCSVTVKLMSGDGKAGKKVALPDDGMRTLYGVIVLIVALHVVGLAALAARVTIDIPQP
ncbi:MAG: hypothetical protein U0795_15250 [Pirellulales bacterium]